MRNHPGMALFDKFRQYKIAHWAYNLIHYKSLLHNKAAYRKYHIRKPLIASISSRDFPDKTSRAWLDRGPSRELVPGKAGYDDFPADVQKQLLDWSEAGYLVLKGFFSEQTVEAINSEINGLVGAKKLIPTHDNKLMFANKMSALIREVTLDKRLTDILSFILDKEVVPFQTIHFIYGSGQRAHSDSIHMTTYPLGYLIAAWVALEDTHPDNGPLFYYPGSHRLPYLLNTEFNEGSTALTLGHKDYVDYEDLISQEIVSHGFEKKIFYAKKGDVLLWHANLVHGGLSVAKPGLTRKSMVVHYFARDVIKYHEITERPSLMEG